MAVDLPIANGSAKVVKFGSSGLLGQSDIYGLPIVVGDQWTFERS